MSDSQTKANPPDDDRQSDPESQEESQSFAADETPPPIHSLSGFRPNPADVPTVRPRSSPTHQIHSPQDVPGIEGYTLSKVLGRGGMGIVYLARQHAPARDVAIKMLHTTETVSQELLQRFQNEASAIAALQHPNIVQIYELGKDPEQPWFSMEYVNGQTLSDQLRGRSYSPVEAAELIETLARALHYAHQHGVIHRDMKPGNVLVTTSGVLKITDFGLAKQLNTDTELTRTGVVMGTPAYMSPEQAAGHIRKLSPASDVFALGVMLYELLTRKRPFQGESHLEVLEQIRNGEPVAPRQLNRAIPQDLETICLKCLRKSPESRYANAEELAEDLRRFQQGLPIHGRRPTLGERLKSEWRYRPGRLVLAAISLLLFATAFGAAFTWFGYSRESVRYFRAVAYQWTVPEGISELTSEEVSHRAISYKITRKGRWGPVLKLEAINGAGELAWDEGLMPTLGEAEQESGRFTARIEYISDQVDGVERFKQKGYDQRGQHLWTFAFTTPNSGHFLDQDGRPLIRSQSGATRIQVEFSSEGYLRKLTYYDIFSDLPKANTEGSYGSEFEYDSSGLVTKIMNLGPDGAPAFHPQGFVQQVFAYNELGEWVLTQYLDREGELTSHKQGYSQIQIERDSWGNEIRKSYLGVDSKPMSNTSGFAIVEMEYDDHGNAMEFQYRSPQGELCSNANGVAIIQREYDEHGRLVALSQFGTRREPVTNTSGVHRSEHEFDHQGNEIRVSVFGVDGKPTFHKQGHSTILREYDDRGRVVKESFLGLTGTPILCDQGYASYQAEYDRNGNVVKEQSFGLDGEPILSRKGYAQRTAVYDHWGNPLEESFFGVKGEPVLNAQGFHRKVNTYDQYGRLEMLKLFDTESELIPHRDGYAWLKRTYNHQNFLIREEYYGTDNQLKPGKEGYAIWTSKRDSRGNMIEIAYLDPEGNPINSVEGFARERREYNERNEVIDLEYFAADGKAPDWVSLSIPISDSIYSNLRGYRYAPYKGDPEWNWKLEFIPASGETVSFLFWYADDEKEVTGVRSALIRFDNLNHLLGFQFLNEKGECIPIEGAAKTKATYNALGLQSEERFYDLAGNPVIGWTGSAGWTMTFDARGNRTRWTAIGTDGKPIRDHSGVPTWINSYDSRGNMIEQWNLGSDDELTLDINGMAGWTAEYDNVGNMVSKTHYGLDREPIMLPVRGYCRWEADYDNRGRLMSRRFFDLEGNPVRLVPVLTGVMPGSQADEVGLQRGDLILSYHGVTGGMAELGYEMENVRESSHQILDQKVIVEYQREGELHSVVVAPGKLGIAWDEFAATPPSSTPVTEKEPLVAPVPVLEFP